MLILIFLPKRALKEVWRGPQNMKQKWNKSPKKGETARGPDTARPCRVARPPVHRRTVGRAPTHGHAPGARLAVHWWCRFLQPLPGVHARAPLWHSRALPVFRCFAILGARGFLEPLIFLEIAHEVFFSIET